MFGMGKNGLIFPRSIIFPVPTMHSPSGQPIQEPIVWQASPSWGQFSWLFLFSLLAAWRGILFLRAGMPGWEMWVVGSLLLLVVAAIIRKWAHYILTTNRIIIQNGYSGKAIDEVDLKTIKKIEVSQGPVAKFWGIGTIVIRCYEKDKEMRLRGVDDPEVVETQIRARMSVTLSETPLEEGSAS